MGRHRRFHWTGAALAALAGWSSWFFWPRPARVEALLLVPPGYPIPGSSPDGPRTLIEGLLRGGAAMNAVATDLGLAGKRIDPGSDWLRVERMEPQLLRLTVRADDPGLARTLCSGVVKHLESLLQRNRLASVQALLRSQELESGPALADIARLEKSLLDRRLAPQADSSVSAEPPEQTDTLQHFSAERAALAAALRQLAEDPGYLPADADFSSQSAGYAQSVRSLRRLQWNQSQTRIAAQLSLPDFEVLQPPMPIPPSGSPWPGALLAGALGGLLSAGWQRRLRLSWLRRA